MPLTQLQQEVLRVIAANRSEASHFAGGMILNASESSMRFSHGFDIFHDAEGRPGWIGSDPTLRPHPPSLRGCWPEVRPAGEE